MKRRYSFMTLALGSSLVLLGTAVTARADSIQIGDGQGEASFVSPANVQVGDTSTLRNR